MALPPIRTFGRTKARALSKPQNLALKGQLEKWRVPDNLPDNFDPKALMPAAKNIWFEIGFGSAEHLIGQAKANPDTLIFGAEPFIEGVAKALLLIKQNEIKNIALIDDDARKILSKLKDNCLERVFILFPDPWPKSRHHKRRLFNQDFIQEMARLIKPNGKLRFATDWANYAEAVLAIMAQNQDFTWTAQSSKDWKTAPSDHFTTRYETKQMGDCAPIFLDFVRH